MTNLPHIIALLEDDDHRAEGMQARLADRFSIYPILRAKASPQLIELLKENLNRTICVLLDHDLEPIAEEDGKLADAGDGREAADFLAQQSPVCPVIIHSTNVPAAIGMEQVLAESGWQVERVTPYDDLAWIDEAWFPLLRNAIVKHAPKAISYSITP